MAAGRHFATLALVAAALLVASCGRKAPLDTPYEAQVQARKDAQAAGRPLPPEPTAPDRDKPFLLDGLL